ncbi:MAG: hypothetical protein R3212_05425 [Xanthomonadales bacterium]|nr:hypothetical protein [Xanthomonadales bacterium]
MNIQRTLVIATTTLLLSIGLVSCSDGNHSGASGNELLAYIPSDSPYFAGNLEPIPSDVIEAAFRRAQPVLDLVQEMLGDTSIRLSGSAAQENPEMAIVGAVLDELDGKLSREGLESIGFALDAYQVVYGMGAFPVIRLSLGSAQALRDTVGRIESASGINFPELEHQGQPYWKLDSGDSDTPASIYVAIIEGPGAAHLALGLLPHHSESTLLPQFLGQELPSDSTAAAQLAALDRTYGYTGHGSGVFDFQRTFEQLAAPESMLNQALRNSGMDVSGKFDAVCRTEIEGLIDRAPRMVFGTTELEPMAMAAQYRVELAGDLASDLADLVADVPPAPSTTERLIEFAFGIRVGAARDFLIRKATELSQEAYQCEHLQDINRRASEALVKLNTPVPPLVNNFLGFRASIDEMPQDQSDLSAVRGTMALHVTKPEMFVGMAQMFLPQMAEIELTKGAPPVQLPESLMPMPGVVAYAAMSDRALGVAMGQGEDARLPDFLNARSKGDGSFMSVNYDMAAYMDRFGAFSDGFRNQAFSNYSSETERNQAMDLAQAFQDAFRNTIGRSHMSLRFDDGGFAIDNKMEFKE